MDHSRRCFVSSSDVNSEKSESRHFTEHDCELGDRLHPEYVNEFHEQQCVFLEHRFDGFVNICEQCEHKIHVQGQETIEQTEDKKLIKDEKNVPFNESINEQYKWEHSTNEQLHIFKEQVKCEHSTNKQCHCFKEQAKCEHDTNEQFHGFKELAKCEHGINEQCHGFKELAKCEHSINEQCHGFRDQHKNELSTINSKQNTKVIANAYVNPAFIDDHNTETNNNFDLKMESIYCGSLKENSKGLYKDSGNFSPSKKEDKKRQKGIHKQEESNISTEKIEIKDSGYAWVVVAAMFVSNILTTGYVKGFGIVYNEILVQYPSASGTMAGIMMSLLSGFRSLFAPLVGTMATYIGVRKTMCVGALLYTSALFASYFCSSLLQLSITLGAIIGLSHCIIESCQVVVISQYFEAKLSKANGIRVAGSPCGGILYPLLLTVLLQNYGLKLTFLFLSAITLNIFICAFLMEPFNFPKKSKVLKSVKRLMKRGSETKESGLSFSCGGLLHSNSGLKNHLKVAHTNEIKGLSYRCNDKAKMLYDPNRDKKEMKILYDPNQDNNYIINNLTLSFGDNKRKIDTQISYESQNFTALNSSIENQKSLYGEKNCLQNIATTPYGTLSNQDGSTETQNSPKKNSKKKLNYSFLKNPQYLLFVFMAAGIPMGLPLVLYYTTIYAKNVAGLTPYEVTILLSYQAVLDVCMRIFIGWVNNKNLYSKSNGFVVCLWLSAIGSVLMTFGNNSLMYLIGVISLYTFGPASYHTFVNVILTENFGKENIASTWGFVRMTQGAFSFLHPTIIGYLVDSTGSYTVPFLVMGSGMFLCGVIIFMGRFFALASPSLKQNDEQINKQRSK